MCWVSRSLTRSRWLSQPAFVHHRLSVLPSRCELAPSAPLAGTSRFRRTAAYRRCLRCAPACGRLGDHRVVPSFRVLLCIGMSSPGTPGSLSAAYTQFLHRRRWPSTESKGLGASHIPTLRFLWGTAFRGFTAVHFRYNLPTCSP